MAIARNHTVRIIAEVETHEVYGDEVVTRLFQGVTSVQPNLSDEKLMEYQKVIGGGAINSALGLGEKWVAEKKAGE